MLWIAALGAAIAGLVDDVQPGLLALAGIALVIGGVLHVLGQRLWRLLDEDDEEPTL